MAKQNQIHLYVVVVLITIGSVMNWSCKPCNSCDDPKLVKVPPADASPPEFHWEMSQAVMHSNGTATSSISIVPAGTSVIHSVAADSVTTHVYLTAHDPQSGVKCIDIKGGFGLTCMGNDSTAVAIDGILPAISQCNDLTACCLKSMRVTVENLRQYMQCNNNRMLSGGGVGLTGILTNCKGGQDTVSLTVQF